VAAPARGRKGRDTATGGAAPDAEVDCVGLFCPEPIARTKEAIDSVPLGGVLKVEADDPAAEEDIPRWAKRAGHELVGLDRAGNLLTFYIRRRA
jgi:TusA-related sulfurtransferase